MYTVGEIKTTNMTKIKKKGGEPELMRMDERGYLLVI